MAYGPVSVGSAPYALPAATASTLGGVKVGSNLSIDANGKLSAPDPYSLTADKITAALGFTPASAASAAQLPYSITYEGCYVGTGKSIRATPLTLTFSQLHDMFGVIWLKKSDFPRGSEKEKLRVLHELLTAEASEGTLKSNIAPMRNLPTSLTSSSEIAKDIGYVAINNEWNRAWYSLCRNDKVVTVKNTRPSTVADSSTMEWNGSDYVHFIFGIDLNIAL